MIIERLLSEASWRLRAFLGSPGIDQGRIGCRCDSMLCPVSEWLFFETRQIALVDAEWIMMPCGSWTTPPVLARFTDLVDAARFAPDAFAAADFRVSRAEALAALAAAEAAADQHLLPMVATSVPRCDYPDYGVCRHPAVTPELHCFIERDRTAPGERPTRENCVPFIGHLCDMHIGALSLVGGAPASWWQEAHEGEAAELVEALP